MWMPNCLCIIESLDDTLIFLTVYAILGLWEVKIGVQDHEKIFFRGDDGSYQIVRVPSRIYKTPVNFEKVVDTKLSPVNW